MWVFGVLRFKLIPTLITNGSVAANPGTTPSPGTPGPFLRPPDQRCGNKAVVPGLGTWSLRTRVVPGLAATDHIDDWCITNPSRLCRTSADFGRLWQTLAGLPKSAKVFWSIVWILWCRKFQTFNSIQLKNGIKGICDKVQQLEGIFLNTMRLQDFYDISSWMQWWVLQ